MRVMNVITGIAVALALGAASLGLVAQPAGAAPPTDTFAEVGAALEAYGITPCATASAKIRGLIGDPRLMPQTSS
jgi:hypothetical protein